VTNGTAVLGLGNIGALAGKPVMEGKGVLESMIKKPGMIEANRKALEAGSGFALLAESLP